MTSKHTLKVLPIFLMSILCFTKANAQDSTKTEQPTEVRSLNKIRLTVLGIGYERELKVGKLTTIYVGGGLASALLVETYPRYTIDNNYVIHYDNDNTNVYFNIAPNLYTGIRKYYNLENRIKKGKKTVNNSGSYFGLDVAGYFSPLLERKNYVMPDWEIAITPQWGIQHSMGKKVNFELSLGPTVHINEFNTYFGADGRIGFSFIF